VKRNPENMQRRRGRLQRQRLREPATAERKCRRKTQIWWIGWDVGQRGRGVEQRGRAVKERDRGIAERGCCGRESERRGRAKGRCGREREGQGDDGRRRDVGECETCVGEMGRGF
jgi:hypothetical protein